MNSEKENKYKSKIEQKCPYCFRKDECMLFSSRHAGIELCLGPFKEDNDWAEKIRAEYRKEEEAIEKEREVGLSKLRRKDRVEEYRMMITLFDHFVEQISQIKLSNDDIEEK